MIPEDKRQELEGIRKTLLELAEECTAKDGYDAVKEQIAQALRAIDQFDSGIEIIVCMGMLKAGKSTLVNLLTRSAMASPTGYGQDVTLRPALIRMAEPGAAPRIFLYEKAAGSEETDVSVLQAAVLDHLRGIEKEGSMSAVSIRSLPLNENSLRGVLCCRVADSPLLSEEPVMVVVETEYNETCRLLRHRNRMLLDMPGCDSATAEVAKGERYREIGKECDMVLLLQSSVAPLNAKAVEELEALLAGRAPSTTRIIQNRMESKAWLRSEVLDAETLDQSNRALSVLRQLSENREIPVSSVNLGMAYAGIFESSARLREHIEMSGGVYQTPAELLAGSGFDAMEDSLHRELSDIRYLHCCDNLRQTLRSLAAAVLVTQRIENKALAALKNRVERWDVFRKVAEDALHSPNVPADAEFSIAPTQMPDFPLICENIYRDRRELYKGPKATGRDINECMTDCNNACRDALREFLFKDLTDRHVQISVGGEICTVSEWCNHTIRHLLKACKQRMMEHDAELWGEFSVPEYPDFQEWQEVHNMPLNPEKAVKENRFNPYIYEERVHRWWWKDADKEYEVFWGNELFVGQVVDPMVKHYLGEADEQLQAQPPHERMQKVITEEVRTTTVNFFSALSAKREKTLSDITVVQERLKSLTDVMARVSAMNEAYEKAH